MLYSINVYIALLFLDFLKYFFIPIQKKVDVKDK